jgi:hypothetical protein
MSIPGVGDVMAAIFGAEAEGEPGLVVYGPCDRAAELDDQPVPYTLTPAAEAVLDGPEPEAEL